MSDARRIGPCEVCGRTTGDMDEIADLVELEPSRAEDGSLYARHALDGPVHTYCREHSRRARRRLLSGEVVEL